MSLDSTLAWDRWVDSNLAIKELAHLMHLDVEDGEIHRASFRAEVFAESRLGNEVNEENWGLASLQTVEYVIASRIGGAEQSQYQKLILSTAIPFLDWLDADGILLFNGEVLYLQKKAEDVALYSAEEWRRLEALPSETERLRLIPGRPPTR